MFRSTPPDDAHDAPPRKGRSWSTRLAWLTLIGGAAILAMRVSVATVVEVHGHGMNPTLREGDYVVIVRESWTVSRGDIVVYDPALALGAGGAFDLPPPTGDSPRATNDDGHEFPDLRRDPKGTLRNTAVVDREELEENWQRVQKKSGGIASRSQEPMRLGRVLAMPGDDVTFHVRHVELGLEIEGEALATKPEQTVDTDDPALAYEVGPGRRYAVRPARSNGATPLLWPGLELPPATQGPVQTRAPGFLIVADNRPEGACCDSRALGWIPESAIKGKVVLKLGGEQGTQPQRTLRWNP